MRAALLTGVSTHVWQQNSLTWVLVAIACGLATVNVVAWRRRAVPAAPWLAGLCLAATVWALADGLGAAAVPLALKITFAKAECLGVLAVGPCWLLLARAVARRPPLRWPAMLALWTLPALCVPIIVTNWRGLVWPSVSVVVTSAGAQGRYDYGAFLWTVIVLTYLAVTVGVVWLAQASRAGPPAYRPPSTFGTSTPSAAEAATAARSSSCQSVPKPLTRTTISRGW